MAAEQFDCNLFSYQATALVRAPNALPSGPEFPPKLCTSCGLTKPHSEFYADNSRADGFGPRCRPCQSSYSAKIWERKQAKKLQSGSKTCECCGLEKAATDFARTEGRRNALDRQCLNCQATAADRKNPRAPFPRSPNAAGNNRRYRKGLRNRDTVPVWTERKCCSCQEIKPAAQFHRNKSEVGGLATRCKECKSAEHRATYEKRLADYNPVETKICLGCGLEKPKDQFYRQTASSSGLSTYCVPCSENAGAQKYQENREERIRSSWIWQKENPERARANRIASRQNKRATEIGADGKFTGQEWLDLVRASNHCCFYCHAPEIEQSKLTADHKIPLGRGGSNWISNIAPSCLRCNATKKGKTPEEYSRWLVLNAEILAIKPNI